MAGKGQRNIGFLEVKKMLEPMMSIGGAYKHSS